MHSMHITAYMRTRRTLGMGYTDQNMSVELGSTKGSTKYVDLKNNRVFHVPGLVYTYISTIYHKSLSYAYMLSQYRLLMPSGRLHTPYMS